MLSGKNAIPSSDRLSIRETRSLFMKRLSYAPSTWSLIIANIATMLMAVTQKWDYDVILWMYWLQNIAIGVCNVITILSLKDYSTKGVKFGDKPLDKSMAAKLMIALFFVVHYGIFHLVYAVFISAYGIFIFKFDKTVLNNLLLGGGVFFLHHLLDLVLNKGGLPEKPNIGYVMFRPYVRVVPMHMIILINGFGWIVWKSNDALMITVFMCIKMIVELFTIKLFSSAKVNVAARRARSR
jgi:hypothetical protein